MNFLQKKLRPRLKEEVIDKLLFIYINSRSLQASRREDKWNTKAFQIQFYDLLLNIEDDMIQPDRDVDIIEE